MFARSVAAKLMRRCLRRFEATFKYSAISAPLIMLAPVWAGGILLLLIQQYRLRLDAERTQSADEVEMVAIDRDLQTAHRCEVAELQGQETVVPPMLFVWAFYVCFIGG